MSYFFKIAQKRNAKGHCNGGGRVEEKSSPTAFLFYWPYTVWQQESHQLARRDECYVRVARTSMSPYSSIKFLCLSFRHHVLFIFVRFARRVRNKTDPYWLPPLSLSILFENIFFWYKNLLATGSSYLRVLKQLSLSCQTIARESRLIYRDYRCGPGCLAGMSFYL